MIRARVKELTHAACTRTRHLDASECNREPYASLPASTPLPCGLLRGPADSPQSQPCPCCLCPPRPAVSSCPPAARRRAGSELGGGRWRARGREGLPGVLAAGWRWPPPGVAAKRLQEPAADGGLCSMLPAARATHGTGHGTSCRDHPSMPGSGRPARLRHALPHTPWYLFGLAAQRAHDDPEVLRIDRARPILVEQVERVLDLIELVLVQLLLSSVELSLCSLLGLRTRADRQQPRCGRAWLTRTWLFLLLSGLLAMAGASDALAHQREKRATLSRWSAGYFAWRRLGASE